MTANNTGDRNLPAAIMNSAGQFGLLLASLFLAVPVFAGPPFLTDDPEPVPYQHYEAYIFSSYDNSAAGISGVGPAVEYNVGAAPELQIHLVVPLAYFSPPGGTGVYGLGDTEFGVKYRFLDETSDRPQIGIFPMVELPTGNAARGLGNGQVWYRLPVWAQKSWGAWTADGGGGYAINRAPGMRDYFFGGVLLQRQLNDQLILGAEIFSQGADTDADRGSTLFNLGGYYNFTPGFSLLFSVGHSIADEAQRIAYLALYWTWGATDGT